MSNRTVQEDVDKQTLSVALVDASNEVFNLILYLIRVKAIDGGPLDKANVQEIGVSGNNSLKTLVQARIQYVGAFYTTFQT